MSNIKAQIRIAATPQVVWGVLNDLYRNPDWIANVDHVMSISNVPIGIGTTFREQIRILGPLRTEAEWLITRFDPPSVHEHAGHLPIIGATTVLFELNSRRDGCLCVATVNTSHGRGLLRRAFYTLFIRPGLALSFQRNLRNLKQLVEACQSVR